MSDRYAVVIMDREGNVSTHAKYQGGDAADNAHKLAASINALRQTNGYRATVIGY